MNSVIEYQLHSPAVCAILKMGGGFPVGGAIMEQQIVPQFTNSPNT